MHQVGQRRCADGCLPWSMAMLQCGSLACVREVAKILWGRPWKEGLGVSGLPAASRDNPTQNEIDGGEPDENPVNPEHVSVHGCHPSKNPTHPQARPAGYHPRENSPSARVRWGAGAPAKAIRRGGHPAGRRTHKTPKHASEPSRAPGRRRRIAGLRACRT